eukprot:CAMPEP_0184425208 /NCGR_PEP_ID=MMETSP0738-20130409/127813_1 /TAXON_ID=385413 /ORGANISM="Thalassiosira miniscula, Strain CCMP1093" /LENGTH=38 /DNA_ID= /DNA_START= /DNA_END= /DNA_ORIENTATION=
MTSRWGPMFDTNTPGLIIFAHGPATGLKRNACINGLRP